MAEPEIIKYCAECFWCVENGAPIDWRCRYLIKDLPDLLRGNSKDMGGTLCVAMRVNAGGSCGPTGEWFKQRHNALKCGRCAHKSDRSRDDECKACIEAGGNPGFEEGVE